MSSEVRDGAGVAEFRVESVRELTERRRILPMRVPGRFLVAIVLLLISAAALLLWQRTRPPVPPPVVAAPPALSARPATPPPPSPSVSVLAINETSRPAKHTRTEAELRAFEERGRHDASLATVTDIYAGFVKAAGLTDAETKQFLELVCDERLAALRIALDLRARGLNYNEDPALEAEVLAAATKRDDAIRQLLGPERAVQFEDYRATAMVRTTIEQVNDRAIDAGEPLTDAQVKLLTQTYLGLQSPGVARRAPIKTVLQLIGMPVTDEVIAASRPILSPTQLAALAVVQSAQRMPNTATVGGPSAPPRP